MERTIVGSNPAITIRAAAEADIEAHRERVARMAEIAPVSHPPRMRTSIPIAAIATLLAIGPMHAQEPVVGAPDAEALFTSPDPKLHRNKQAAYHIQRDLIESGHWEMAERWLTERYIQHNPNA